MRTAKRIFNLFLLTAIFTVITVNAATPPEQHDIQPRYTGVASVMADLDISSSGRASVYGNVRTIPGYTASITVSLRQDTGTSVKSWSSSGSGTITIDKIYYVATGHDYFTSVQVNAYNSSGTLVDSITVDSNVVSH